jgi:hypothetical protein
LDKTFALCFGNLAGNPFDTFDALLTGAFCSCQKSKAIQGKGFGRFQSRFDAFDIFSKKHTLP